MSKPKVLLYAPREEPKPIIDALRNAGLDVIEGDRRWQTPGGEHREPFLAAARDAVALMGTYSRFTPLDRPLRCGERPWDHGLSCADRGELLRRRRNHHRHDPGFAQARARTR
jgi:hypothetical protein